VLAAEATHSSCTEMPVTPFNVVLDQLAVELEREKAPPCKCGISRLYSIL
jgi:hypothetical protein